MKKRRTMRLGLGYLACLLAASVAMGEARVDPKALALRTDDLPGRFAMAGGDHQPGGEYVAMYMRPEVIAAPELPRGALLGVMASLAVLGDVTEARAGFSRNADAESIRGAIRAAPQGAAGRIRQLEAGPGLAADEALLFRVEYVLAEVPVVEYRYRLRVANAIANLLVSGRAGNGGVEPPDLESQARSIAERQIARMREAKP